MEKDHQKDQLVTYTALAVIAQQDTEQIQLIRKIHDPAYQRWMPHINISFPFVHPEKFDQAHQLLQEAFKDFKSFEIRFTQMDFFPHGTVFIVPQTQNNKELQQIYNRVCKTLPNCKSNRDFHPHMTVGKFNKQNVHLKCEELKKNWKEWRIKCRGLNMIRRQKDTPFRTQKFVKFQQ